MINNPYASKSKRQQQQQQQTNNSAAISSSQQSTTTAANNVTFSQAFAYSTTAGTTAASTVATNSITDRDRHAMLQSHSLYASVKQRGNGILDYIRNVPVAFDSIVPDYIMSTTRCALFLSLKYHSLYNDYISKRVAELRTDFELRVLLVLVDVADNANALLYLNKFAVTHNLTMILAWSEEEAARYLETFKALDGKDATTALQKKESTNFVEQANDVLLSGKTSVNQTDCGQLLSHFGTIRGISKANREELSMIPGMGPNKVQRLHDAWHKPFSTKAARERQRLREAAENASMGSNDEQQNDQQNDDGDNIDAKVSDDVAEVVDEAQVDALEAIQQVEESEEKTS